MTYQLKSQQFTGPLDKLLELIEERKLEITRLNLAEITSDFLGYVNSLRETEAGILADFLSVAAKLVLLKSKALLPSLEIEEEEERELQDLETRLKLFRRLKEAAENLEKIWNNVPVCAGRKFDFRNLGAVFYAPRLKIQDVYSACRVLAGNLESIYRPSKTLSIKIVSVEEKMKDILARISRKAVLVFHKDFSDGQTADENKKEEILALFLAVLQLAKEHSIFVSQKKQFEDIIISPAP